MAHTVYLGSFNKRLNSTKQPTHSGWASYSCVFKDETSLIRPTIRLSADFATFSSSHYNYAYMLGRYYWIRDIRSVRSGYVEVDMSIDPLATCKSAILATNAYIEYGFNTFNAGDSSTRYPDNRIPVNENPTMYTANFDMTGGLLSTLNGCYVIQAVGNNSNGAHKGLATFVLTQAQLARLMASINTSLSNTIDGYLNNTQLTAQEVMNYITSFSLKQELLNESALAALQSVKWLPLDISGAHGNAATLYLGNYSTGITDAIMLDQNSYVSQLSAIDIPWPVSDWKRNNCQLLLYLPFVGTIPIPIDQSINTSALGISWTAEYFSGSMSVIVRTGDGAYTVYAGSTNISVEMGIGRSQVGTSQLLGGSLQALGGAIQMGGGALDMTAGSLSSFVGLSHFAEGANAIAGGLQNVYGGLMQTIQPVVTCTGSMGGMAAIGQTQPGRLAVIYYPPVDEAGFSAVYGHPVCKVTTPTSGFCKTRGFSISLSEPGELAGIINNAMDGGVFIE